ncbi:MAG: threonine--tRNA ligase [Solirubrobacteraceae bacterium]
MPLDVTLPDGKTLELSQGATGADAAAAIGPGLARAALAIEVDGAPRDLARPLEDGARIAIITTSSGAPALELMRHDAAHVLAAAVTELYPGVKISIGPPIDQGFYYDFEFPEGVVLSEADFPAIEARMRQHVKAGETFVREDVSVAEARDRFARADQPYKVELIDDLVAAADPDAPLETVSLYTNGPFTDLCRGPHAPTTKTVRAFTLQSVAGAYWRGDSTRTMLTRVYGTAFFSREDLAAHLERLEQARARDHRKLGRELGLFHFNERSPGSAFWLPNGTTLWNTLVALSRELTAKHGYDEVKTPQLYDAELWRISGHWDKYRENMFITESEGRQMAIKPMNCPGHFLLYNSQRHSYRDLPVRYAEPGLLHRNEASGTLHGLLRVRHFTQDDAHIMCTEDQIQAEVAGCLDMGFEIYRMFGFTPELELSTRPEVRLGDDALWDRAEGELTRALESRGLPYKVNEGDGAFYGPKIDLHMTDAIGRSWQLGTVQLDYGNPERFDMTYTGADNAEHRPVVIHRALMGTFERFIGIITEHYAGDFPVWLTPVQAIVLPISDRLAPVAAVVLATLKDAGIRGELDDRTESVGRKIRDAELRKIPYMLVVGDREAADGTVAVRERHHGDVGSVPVPELVARISARSRDRSA